MLVGRGTERCGTSLTGRAAAAGLNHGPRRAENPGMGSSLLHGLVGRTVLPLVAAIGGFAGLYAGTGNPFICAIWASLAAHVVLLMPWRRRGGRANHASILFGQPIALSEREKAQIDVDAVTAPQRREAAIVVAAVFALLPLALALALTG
jgi:hypothetical protein